MGGGGDEFVTGRAVMAATGLPAASVTAPSDGVYETVTVWPPSTASTSASVTVFRATPTAVTGHDRLSTRTENAAGGALPVSVSSNSSVSVEPETAAALGAGEVVSIVQVRVIGSLMLPALSIARA